MIYDVDSEGFLINPTSMDNVSEHWKSVIDEVITLSSSVHGDNLHSLYIRGSVPEGTAHDYSDLDMICVLSERKETNLNDDHKKSILDMNLKKVDYSLIALDDFTEETEFLLKVQSLYLFGKDLIPDIKKFSISDVPKIDLDRIADGFYDLCSYGISDPNATDDEKKAVCRWLSRQVLMSAYNIVISREGVYTRDLTSCYLGYSKYYHLDIVKEFFDYYNNPITDLELLSDKWVEIEEILEGQFKDRTLD